MSGASMAGCPHLTPSGSAFPSGPGLTEQLEKAVWGVDMAPVLEPVGIVQTPPCPCQMVTLGK